MDAGRELDAKVATHVMGLNVVAHDWPCGTDYDCCSPEAWSWPNESPPEHFTPQPIYAPDEMYTVWPAKVSEPAFDGDTKNAYVHVEVVSCYSTDIAAAWQVVFELGSSHEFNIRYYSHTPFKGEEYTASFRILKTVLTAHASIAPHAICLAALQAVGVTP